MHDSQRTLWSRGWVVDGYALFAGIAIPFAFAPFQFYPLALIAPILLFGAWFNASPARACWRGWLFGMGMFGIGVSWIHESFQFSHISLPIAIVLTVLLISFLAVFPAVLGLLTTRSFIRSDRIRFLLVLPAAWTLAEWIRGWFLTGFTWLQVGYSQVDSPLSGLVPIVGVYGVSWVSILSAGLVFLTLREGRTAWYRYLPVVAAIWVGAGFMTTIHWTEDSGEKVRVALVQGNVPQDVKWLPEQRQPTVDRYLSLTRQHWDADLIVWPEAALPGTYDTFEAVLSALALEAEAHETDVLIGIPTRRPGDRYFNSVVAPGRPPAFYHKRHLVPFGEYLPIAVVLQPVVDLLGIPVANFEPGEKKQPLLNAAGETLGVSICYEAAFGAEIIKALPEASLLVNVSNDAWFGDSIAPHQHLEMARYRALETGRYLVRATNTGISAIIGPKGNLELQAPQFETAVIAGDVKPMVGGTPYTYVGDTPVIVGVIFALVVAVIVSLRRGAQTAKRRN